VRFVHALLEGLSSPAEAALGLARPAVTECQADLGLESAALKAGEAMGSGAKQLLRTIHITDQGGGHRDGDRAMANPRPVSQKARGPERVCG
jgi:hypothetical protein